MARPDRLLVNLARLAGCLCGLGLGLAWTRSAPPPWPGYAIRGDVTAADGSHVVTYAPVPPPPVAPETRPAAKSRARYGPAVWANPGNGGGLADFEILGTAADRKADRMGIRVRAAKSGVRLSNGLLSGCSNGLTVEHTADVLRGRVKDWRVEGLTFCDNNGSDRFRGQGAYVAAGDRWTFYRCTFLDNGRDADVTVLVNGRPFVVSSGFRKAAYVQGGLTQWKMPEGCTKVRFEECVFTGNSAEGVCGKGDGTEVVNCFFADNAWGCMVNGPLASTVTGNVVIAGPRAVTWYDPKQRAGAGGIQWRTASGTLSDNLCVLPPENRMPDRNWRAPAFELTLDANAKPNYHGVISATGRNNVALGWDADVVTRGAAVPGLRTGPCPAADWAGLVKRAEAQARAGTADARDLIAEARRMAGAN